MSDHEFRQFVENGILTSEMDDIESNLEAFRESSKFEDEVSVFGLRNLSYSELNDENDIPKEIRQWLDVRQLRVMCNKRHRQMKKLAHVMAGDNEAEKQEVEEHLNRYVFFVNFQIILTNTRVTFSDKSSKN